MHKKPENGSLGRGSGVKLIELVVSTQSIDLSISMLAIASAMTCGSNSFMLETFQNSAAKLADLFGSV